jgi:hypothetical protein
MYFEIPRICIAIATVVLFTYIHTVVVVCPTFSWDCQRDRDCRLLLTDAYLNLNCSNLELRRSLGIKEFPRKRQKLHPVQKRCHLEVILEKCFIRTC